MATIPNCAKCNNFVPATDPQIVKVYSGQCMKLEWPYAKTSRRSTGSKGSAATMKGPGPRS